MTDYLACLKKVRGTNDDECRMLAKAYLQCRMDQWVSLPLFLGARRDGRVRGCYSRIIRGLTLFCCASNLMLKDDFKNLGFEEKVQKVQVDGEKQEGTSSGKGSQT